MEQVNQKSKLKAERGHLLNRYLKANRAGQLAGKPEDEPDRSQQSDVAR